MNDINYIKFIKDCDYITNCQKSQYVKLNENINTIFIKQSTNLQIYTYIKNSLNNMLRIVKIKTLFNHFIIKQITNKIIKKIKKIIKNNKTITDGEIMDKIIYYKSMDKYINLKNKYKENKNKDKDISGICSDYKYIFEYIGLKNRQLFKDTKNIKYLDFGCGFGAKTRLYSKELNIPKYNIFTTDIKQWSTYEQENIKHEFNFKYILEDGSIDYPDNTFDFITAFYVLHHIENLTHSINEIKRVLKPNGYFLILEHDNHDDYDFLLIDIEHLFYAYFYDKKIDFLKNPEYSKYYNWLEWNYYFSKHNFTYVNGNVLFTEVSHDMNYNNVCYSIYKNKKL